MMYSAQARESLDPAAFSVLVVDDEPMLRSVIQDFLNMLGFPRNCTAGDGREALEVIRSQPIHCVLSDIRMPNMELEGLLGVLKQEFPEIFVIAISGHNDFDTASNILRQGAHDFLEKPLDLDALEVALHWVLERREILRIAASMFGAEALPIPETEIDPRIESLLQSMDRIIKSFRTLIDHALRMTRVLRRLKKAGVSEIDADLQIAAALHEMGASYQMLFLCQQPRRLEIEELDLVHSHARMAGRLVSEALERLEFESIIGEHYHWQQLAMRQRKPTTPHQGASIWLGMLNAVDGWLQNRADRPATSIDLLKAQLERQQQSHAIKPISRLLDHWNVIEEVYS